MLNFILRLERNRFRVKPVQRHLPFPPLRLRSSMASPTSQPATPEKEVPSDGANTESPGGSSSTSSTGESPDIKAFLTQFRDAAGAKDPDINVQMKRKREEREQRKKEAKDIAKQLKKLRQQKTRTAKKTKGATTEDLLQALADRAEAKAKAEVEAKAKRDKAQNL